MEMLRRTLSSINSTALPTGITSSKEGRRNKKNIASFSLDKENSPFLSFPTNSASEDGDGDDDASVKVVVRVRPSTAAQKKDGAAVLIELPRSLTVEGRSFEFHGILGPMSNQEEVFKLVGVPLVRNSLAGFNTSIVSYGQSASGKTYTMWGPPSAMVDSHSIHANCGIASRIFQMLFKEIKKGQANCETKQQSSYQCRCSFIEIHNEQINNLLDPTQRNMQIRNDAARGIHVENLADVYVANAEDVNQILIKGLSNRKVGATSMNSKSSRSHIIFTCIVESWCKGSSLDNFNSLKTSKITLVDLAGLDMDECREVSPQCIKEERYVKRSLSKLGMLVNMISTAGNGGTYQDAPLTHLLMDTLGGNSKVTFLCTISPDSRYKVGTLATLRFGDRAKHMQNKAVVNEITEHDVNSLSDQIRQLKDELVKEKSDIKNTVAKEDKNLRRLKARDSQNLLMVSLNRSLMLPSADFHSKDDMEVDEEDIRELCDQINNMHSSSEVTLSNFVETDVPEQDSASSEAKVVGDNSKPNNAFSEVPAFADPTVCLSPKIQKKIKKTICSSSHPTKLTSTESLAASIQHGLHIIENHDENLALRKSLVDFSFGHFTLNSRRDASTTILCSSCKTALDASNNDQTGTSISKKSIVLIQDSEPRTVSQESCPKMIKEKEEVCEMTFDVKEREALLDEIQRLKEQLKQRAEVYTDDCLLEQIREGATKRSGDGLEREREKWTESESRWICLTEELRVDLEMSRRLVEKKDTELNMEKKITAELDDALHRAVHGHSRMVEHYVELQENYNELYEKHYRIMEGIAEVKRVATRAAGRKKGCGSAFAAALSAELTASRIDREKERAQLKEQNHRLRMQLRDTADAVQAAGELLVRLREADEAVARAEEKYVAAEQENVRLRKQMDKVKKKHEVELTTLKHCLAESRLPECALRPLYEESKPDSRASTVLEDQSWRSAFCDAYQ